MNDYEITPMEELRRIVKAEAEAKEISIIAQDTNKTLQAKLNSKLAHKIDTDEHISDKLDNTANRLVDMGMEIQKNKVEEEINRTAEAKNQAEFKLAEDQYRSAGLERAPSKLWQRRMVSLMYDFWFVIARIICFFTLTPFYVFLGVIKAQSGILKFVATVVGIILLLTCLGSLTYWVLNITKIL